MTRYVLRVVRAVRSASRQVQTRMRRFALRLTAPVRRGDLGRRMRRLPSVRAASLVWTSVTRAQARSRRRLGFTRGVQRAARAIMLPFLGAGRALRSRALRTRKRAALGYDPSASWASDLVSILLFAWWPVGLRRTIRPVTGMHLKQPGVPYAKSFQQWDGKLRLKLVEWRAARRKRLLLRQYRRRAATVDLSVPFVYVALHFQPERTTSSLGGAFCNQYLMVDLLARTVPDGWRVYVKEHPSQFYPKFAGERARFPGYYDSLADIPGVQLVPLTVSPFQLIDASRAVATVTGTSGWEALARGKPVLLFGFGAWYKGAEGTLHVTTERECREAFTRLQAGVSMDDGALRRFMQAVDRASVRADMGYGTPDELTCGIGHGASVEALTAALKRWDGSARVHARPASNH